MLAKNEGYPVCLYVDAKTNQYIEEFSTSNFIAIDNKGAFVTPKSSAILGSITNKSLMELAKNEGIDVQVRPVSIDELKNFVEVAACGTAVVVTPVKSIKYKEKVCYQFILFLSYANSSMSYRFIPFLMMMASDLLSANYTLLFDLYKMGNLEISSIGWSMYKGIF